MSNVLAIGDKATLEDGGAGWFAFVQGLIQIRASNEKAS
jgi:hypothetical protein